MSRAMAVLGLALGIGPHLISAAPRTGERQEIIRATAILRDVELGRGDAAQAHSKRSVQRFPEEPLLRALQITASGQQWRYSGMSTLAVGGPKQESLRAASGDFALGMTVTVCAHEGTSVKTIRYREARPKHSKAQGLVEPATSFAAVWLQDGVIGDPIELRDGWRGERPQWRLVDALNLPVPFEPEGQQHLDRVSRVPLFGYRSDRTDRNVSMRLRRVGEEHVGSSQCIRLERTLAGTLPASEQATVDHFGVEEYRETFWLDLRTGALLRYDASVGLRKSNLWSKHSVSIKLEEVRQVTPPALRAREQEAQQLMEAARALREARATPGMDAGRLDAARGLLQTIRRKSPRLTYASAADTLEWVEHEFRAVAGVKRSQVNLVGHFAPVFTLRDTNGHQRSLASYRGKILLLNFFASWCGPCNAEAPLLEQQVWQRFRRRGVVVVGIGCQEDAAPSKKAIGFRDKHRLTYPVLIDSSNVAARSYAVSAIPTNIVIGRDGTVRYAGEGFDLDAVTARIRGLLRERPNGAH